MHEKRELALSMEIEEEATEFRKLPSDDILFSSEMKKRKNERKNQQQPTSEPEIYKKNHMHKVSRDLLQASKSSSTSSLYINDNSLTVPNIDLVLHCMASALFVHIRSGHMNPNKVFIDIFDETKHPISKQYNVDTRMPKTRIIYKFLNHIFTTENLPSEVAILCLAYIERLIKATQLCLHATNWRRVLLSALILASKVWEDQAVWNVDFIDVFTDMDVTDLNTLEKAFLKHIEYNVLITGQLYAKYYFELRELAEKDKKEFPLQELDIERAKILEARSKRKEKSMKNWERKSVSSECLPIGQRPKNN